MAAERDVARQRLSRLLEDVQRDAAALETQAARVREVASGPDASLPDHARAAVLAVALHAYYGAAESLAERVARTFDGGVPDGADWHRQLLQWMSAPLGEERPAVFSERSHRVLLRLLAFRHFFRHAYAVELDLDQLLEHARELAATHGELVGDVERFASHLAAVRDVLT